MGITTLISQKRIDRGIERDERTGLWFNAANEVICSNYCVNRARLVTIWVRGGSEREGQDGWAQASDGRWVSVGEAKCGNHDRGYRRDSARDIPARLIKRGKPDFNLREALERYESDLVRQQERADRHEREYIESLKEVASMTAKDFTITHEAGPISKAEPLPEMRWVVKGPVRRSGTADYREVAWVELSVERGVWAVHTGGYGGYTGRGRGSAALAYIVSDLLNKAAVMAEERNSAWSRRVMK